MLLMEFHGSEAGVRNRPRRSRRSRAGGEDLRVGQHAGRAHAAVDGAHQAYFAALQNPGFAASHRHLRADLALAEIINESVAEVRASGLLYPSSATWATATSTWPT